MASLDILVNDARIGAIEQLNGGKLKLEYEPRWRAFPRSFPLSFSLPLAPSFIEGRVVENFLWNLLPDNDATIKEWGRHYGVNPRNPFSLLEAVGEDCAGAIQLVPSGTGRTTEAGGIEWIDEAEVGRRLKRLREDRTWTGRDQSDKGHFSLAGAQPKMALYFKDGRWGIPFGRMPTTHILKPPIPGFEGTTVNEHACLRLASRLGLNTARSSVGRFDDEVAIVVERYDRVHNADGTVRRIHQEDLAQAMGIHPEKKYQRDGGPSAEAIARILDATTKPAEAKDAFARSLALNFLIYGTDAHAKNFSIVHDAGRKTYMAPLYDIISYAPYVKNKTALAREKMAQKIGGQYSFSDVMPRHWERQANLMGMDPDAMIEMVAAMAERIPDEMSSVRAECDADGLKDPVIDVMTEKIVEHCRAVAAFYAEHDTGVGPPQP